MDSNILGGKYSNGLDNKNNHMKKKNFHATQINKDTRTSRLFLTPEDFERTLPGIISKTGAIKKIKKKKKIRETETQKS